MKDVRTWTRVVSDRRGKRQLSEDRHEQRDLAVLGFIEALLHGGAVVRVAVIILMRRRFLVFAAGEETEPWDLLQATMIRGWKPDGYHGQHRQCPQPLHVGRIQFGRNRSNITGYFQ